MLTLPFAEDLHFHDTNPPSQDILSLLNDSAFPPLHSTRSNHHTSDDNGAFTIWANHRSYAETAAQSGLKHEPIPVLDVFAPSLSRSLPRSTEPFDPEKYRADIVDDDLIYEQTKSLASRKIGVDHTAYARKLKTVEIAYHLNMQESIRKLPPSQDAQLQRAKSILKGAHSLASGYFKRLPCFTPPDYRFDLPQDWTYNCSMQEYPQVLREYIVKEHMYDPDVEDALDELQGRIHMAYWGNAEWVRKNDYITYHITMEHVLKNRFIPQYELLVKKLEIDQAKTQKQRLWRIRNAIPSTKYIQSKTSRVQYAKQILHQ
ncbi:hypothetical protein BJV82DRAFT_627484 [Fennellomyces sp. T-0311]|nr:hypothetical protein BJV82DRAFT_627484 [Fennellomyces sp. T-0311]